MRYIIKGGVWKNSEDEILKAAVMKYGLNQWSRISSLLVRKSAKQCKQRWYEWLDPSIKKTEWTREEEEKLLHLAKIFPSQWRTIAPIVGRTPMQCVEKYERLLDQAQGKDSNDPNDPRRLRPGEIDPNPETKPARPDPIDMDEDEKEMLAEARVRLANTKGKKAKRKARGKMIEEARRLAFLQKKRELKAAGIEFVNHRIEKVQKGIDYNAEIAFERMVPNFVFKPPEEENPQPDKTITNVSLQVLEGKRRDEEEESKRKIDQRRLKKLKERELEQAVNMHNKTATFFQVKSKMQLPDPQLKDQDLELLGKLNAVNEVSEYSSHATRALVGNYSQREGNLSVMRTPKAPNTVMREAQNILALQQTETPLAGGENIPLNTSGQISSTRMGRTPMSQLVSTPNALARMLRTPNQQTLGKSGAMTPASGGRSVRGGILSESGPGSTPIHDAFKLNNEELDPSWDEQSQQSQFAKMNANQVQIQRAMYMRQLIKTGLANLPKPKNEFSIIIPDVDDEETTNQSREIIDSEDQVSSESKLQKENKMKKHQQRSQAYQKNLAPPRTLPNQPLYEESDNTIRNRIEKILQDTVISLIQEDLEDQGIIVGATVEAQKLLGEEIQFLKNKFGGKWEQLEEKWNNIRNNIEFDPYSEKFVNLNIINEEKKLAVLKASYLRKRSIIDKLDKRSVNLEQKLRTILKGYQMRMEGLEKSITKLQDNLKDTQIEIQVYQHAVQQERQRYLDRVDEMAKFHDMLVVKENELQIRHEELMRDYAEIEMEDDLFQ